MKLVGLSSILLYLLSLTLINAFECTCDLGILRKTVGGRSHHYEDDGESVEEE
jgi:hypothetical protein